MPASFSFAARPKGASVLLLTRMLAAICSIPQQQQQQQQQGCRCSFCGAVGTNATMQKNFLTIVSSPGCRAQHLGCAAPAAQ
jgi:hypothetical protein